VLAGAWVHSEPRVATPIRPRPAYTVRIAPVRERVRGQSRARNNAGPTASVSPAYPRNRVTGLATATDRCSPSVAAGSGGRADGAPTENVRAPPTGWLSAEITR
jgi:hypothetical protein